MIELAFFFAIALALTSVGAGSALAYRRGRDTARRQFQEFARLHALTFSERGALDVWVAHGTWEDSELRLIAELTPLYTLRCIKIRLQHKRAAPFQFTMSHVEGALAPGSRHEIGDPDFDRAFLNDGDLSHARVMLDPKTRATLQHLVDPAFEERWRELTFQEDTWTLIKGYEPDHAAEMPDGLEILRDSLRNLRHVNARMQAWPCDLAQGLYEVLGREENAPGMRALAARDLFLRHPSSAWAERARQEREALGPEVKLAHVLFEPGDHEDAFELLLEHTQTEGRWSARAHEVLVGRFAWQTFRHPKTRPRLRQEAMAVALEGRADADVDRALYGLLVPQTQPAVIEGAERAALLEMACDGAPERGRRTMYALAGNGDIDANTRGVCARVLARAPSPRDLGALVSLLDHPDASVVLWVIGGLELLGDGGAIQGLRGVTSRRGAVSDRAARAIAAILEGLDPALRGGLTLDIPSERIGGLSQVSRDAGGLMVWGEESE